MDMKYNWLERTELLMGKESLERVRNASVCVVGLGGVGAYAAEMIARAGVGKMLIIDPEYRDWETDRKSTRLNSSHRSLSRMPSSA